MKLKGQRPTDQAVDFPDILNAVETYDPPLDDMSAPIEVERQHRMIDMMDDMIAELARRDIDPQKCVFYMNPNTHQRISVELSDAPISGTTPSPASYRDVTIRTDTAFPDRRVLCCPPDAVTLGGKIINPLTIAYSPPAA
jgi:hypothetical protein